METKRAAFNLEAFDDVQGSFEGYLVVFEHQDGNGDIIDRGAFAKTLLDAHVARVGNGIPYLYPLLWQHDAAESIGGIREAAEDSRGLCFKGEFDLDIPRGRQAYSGAKKGYLKGLSIGYRAITSRYDQKGARHLAEVQLFEGSPVTFPANDLAQVASVKSRGFGGALAAAELELTMTMIGIDLELALLKASAPSALDYELARVDDLLARFDKAVRRG